MKKRKNAKKYSQKKGKTTADDSSKAWTEGANADPTEFGIPQRSMQNRTWLYAMASMAVLLAIVAGVVASRNRPQKDVWTPTSGSSFSEMGASSSVPPLAHKWKDFAGHAQVANQNHYRIIETFRHDPRAFCQGLQWHNGRLVESTGMYGESVVRTWDPWAQPPLPSSESGVEAYPPSPVIQDETAIDDKFFGEGLTWFQTKDEEDRYIQLTWKEQTAFVFDTDLQIVDQFKYTTQTTQGWGIAFDPIDKVFYVSDGSEWITVWDLQFKEIRKFQVSMILDNEFQRNNKKSEPYLKLINELEWDPVDRTLLANVWYQNAIVRIHPTNGQVLQIYDFSSLYTNRDPSADVMNGIAYYPSEQSDNQWFLTGKYWPNLYLVELLK